MSLPAHALAATLACVAGGALAVPTLINDDIPKGVVAFDTAVAAGGGVLRTQSLWFLEDGGRSFSFADFTITGTDGGPRLVQADYAGLRANGSAGALSGWALGIVPNAPAATSGLSFTFSQPINAFGLEVGDWATCCYPSSLYIAFDGGATRLVATALAAQDNPGVPSYGQHTNFVGAIDGSGSFTRVMFYGDAVDEFIVAGGTIRYALVVSEPIPAVPEPRGAALLAGGLLWLALRRRGERARAGGA